MRILIVTAVEREAEACRALSGACVVAGGVGRTNAALATTRELLDASKGFDAVLSMGVAGSLPGSELAVGDVVIGARSVYHEEGIVTPEGFRDASALGFPLGAFDGNAIPASRELLDAARSLGRVGDIATVATCSGTDAAAHAVRERTGALVEAMEGAAVLHVAGALGVPALEIRTVSNTTGDRDAQTWDLESALRSLGEAASALATVLGAPRGG